MTTSTEKIVIKEGPITPEYGIDVDFDAPTTKLNSEEIYGTANKKVFSSKLDDSAVSKPASRRIRKLML